MTPDIPAAIAMYGPCYELIADGLELPVGEVINKIENTPALRNIYHTRIARIKLLIRECEGNISAIADAINLPRYVVDYIITSNPFLSHLHRDEGERLVDDAESQLREGVREGKRWAVEMTLSRRGAKRGWAPTRTVEVETIEDWQEIVEGALSIARRTIDVEVTPVDAKRKTE